MQAVTGQVHKCLLISVLLRAGFRSHGPETKAETGWDIRLAIGIGAIDQEELDEISIGLMDGTAFQRSGRALDDLEKSKARIKVVTADLQKNQLFQVVLPFVDHLIMGWSRTQAQAVYRHLLQPDLTQAEIGQHINTSQRAVSKTLDASKVELIKNLLGY